VRFLLAGDVLVDLVFSWLSFQTFGEVLRGAISRSLLFAPHVLTLSPSIVERLTCLTWFDAHFRFVDSLATYQALHSIGRSHRASSSAVSLRKLGFRYEHGEYFARTSSSILRICLRVRMGFLRRLEPKAG